MGRNPGNDEDIRGTPFVGASGRVLRGWGDKPGIYADAFGLRSRITTYYSNAVRCFRLENAAPTLKQAHACGDHVRHDLSCIATQHSGLRYILLLGADCLRYFYTGIIDDPSRKSPALRDALTQYARPVTINGHAFLVFTTYHPAAFLRDRNHIVTINGVLSVLSNHIAGDIPDRSSPDLQPPSGPPDHAP